VPVEPPEAVRLDRWLWAARFYKTRSLAVAAVEGGKVQLNGDRAKRSKAIKCGDRLRIRQDPYEYLITVTAVSDRRGPASQAAALYRESEESIAAREELAFRMKHADAPVFRTKGRPTKKERRDIERWKDRG